MRIFVWEPRISVRSLRREHVSSIVFFNLISAVLFTVDTTSAQVANPELEACRATGLIALRERNPAIKDVSLDMDSMTVAKANTKVEDTPIRTIVVGDAYLEQGRKDSRRTFLCLIGEKGKVLLTFFTKLLLMTGTQASSLRSLTEQRHVQSSIIGDLTSA